MTESQQNIKNHLTELITENLQDFDLVDGGKQRTIGDLIENMVINIIKQNQGEIIQEVKLSKGKKSTEDVAFVSDGVKYLLDPKSHNVDSDFSMPNLISIDKLRKLLSKNVEKTKPVKKTKKLKKTTLPQELMFVFVDYKIESDVVKINSVNVTFVWELDMSILGIGALGKGQLQIKNLNKDLIFTNEGKHIWFQRLRVEVKAYLEKQIVKIQKLQEEWNNIEN